MIAAVDKRTKASVAPIFRASVSYTHIVRGRRRATVSERATVALAAIPHHSLECQHMQGNAYTLMHVKPA